MKVKINCKKCGKEKELYPSHININGNFCSKECRKSKLIKNCENCGEQIELIYSKRERRFCSLKCRPSHEGNKKGTFKNCDYCNKETYIQKYRYKEQEKYYCTTECAGKAKRNRIKVICKNCKKEVWVKPHKVNQKYNKFKYCSKKCCWEDEDFKNKTRENLKRIKPKFKFNKFEKNVYKFLEEHNISFNPQFLVNGYPVDAFIIKLNLIIQFDGDYWHGNNKIFPKLDQRQINAIKRDKLQNKLFKEKGYNLIRIWQSDFDKDPAILLKRIRKVEKKMEKNK